MFKVLFILIFSLAECYGHGLCQAPERHLGGCWEDAQNVDLGYLWFEKSTPRHHRNALDFCKDKDSFLVEIFNPTQTLFLEGRILNIDASHTKWWTGGKYQRETKEWIWMNSSQPVGNFVWFRDFIVSLVDRQNICHQVLTVDSSLSIDSVAAQSSFISAKRCSQLKKSIQSLTEI